MSSVTFSFDQTIQPLLKLSTEEAQGRFRNTANQMALSFFSHTPSQDMPIVNDENQRPKIRSQVSEKELENLRIKAAYYPELYHFFPAIAGLIDTLKRMLYSTDFSNGYEEEERNHADLEKMGGLFRTYWTIHETYIDKFESLEGKNPFGITSFAEWFHAVMGNLSLEILQEVAKNNLESRRGQLEELHRYGKIYPVKEYNALRNHILMNIGALDPKQNPEGWVDAALANLGKFLELPTDRELEEMNPKKQEIVIILEESLALLIEYSH